MSKERNSGLGQCGFRVKVIVMVVRMAATNDYCDGPHVPGLLLPKVKTPGIPVYSAPPLTNTVPGGQN